MKHTYPFFTSLLLLLFTSALFAQLDCTNPDIIIDDDLDSYTLGDASGQAPHWAAWPGASLGGEVIADPTSNSLQVIRIDGSNAGQDALWLLGDPVSSHFIVYFNLYIPTGNNAYFNLQHEMPTSSAGFWAFDAFFNDGGSGEIDLNNNGISFNFSFEHDDWFEVYIFADIDSDEARMVIGTTTVASWNFSNGVTNGNANYPSNQLNSINFFPIDNSYVYYVDDVALWELPPAETNQYCYTATDITPGIHSVADLECYGALWDIDARFANSGAWYSYNPVNDGVISISSCGGAADSRGWIFEGDCHDFKIRRCQRRPMRSKQW